MTPSRRLLPVLVMAAVLTAGTTKAEDGPIQLPAPTPAQGPIPPEVPARPATAPAVPSASENMPLPGAPAAGAASEGGTESPTSLSDRSPDLVFDTAILQGMDKVTGRVMTIEAPVGSSVHFGTLELVVRTCRKRPPEDAPESAAFLDIWEVRNGQAAESLFRGWMFASSPALSALEHPVYDIWVLDCADSKAKGSSPPKSP